MDKLLLIISAEAFHHYELIAFILLVSLVVAKNERRIRNLERKIKLQPKDKLNG